MVNSTDLMLPIHADLAGVKSFPQTLLKALLSQAQGTSQESHIRLLL